MASRPAFYSLIDLSFSNIDLNYAESPLNTVGFQQGQTIPSKIHNTLWLIDGLWQTYFDYGILRIPDYVDTAVTQRWSTDKLLYPVGTSVVAGPGAKPLSFGVYFFDGFRIELSELLMKPSGADPLLQPLATKPGRLWIYLRTADISPSQPFATIRVESVDPVDLSTPGAGELALVGVDIDAAGVTTGNTYPVVEPLEIVQFGTRGQVWKGPATFDIGLTALIVESTNGYQGVSGGPALAPQGFSTDGAATFNSSVDLGDLATDPITVIGALTVNEFAVFASGVQGPALGPLVLNEGATIPANKSIVGDVTTRLTTGKVTSLTLVEAVDGFQGSAGIIADLPHGAAIPTGKDLTLSGTASIVGTATSTVTAGTFDTIDETGLIKTGAVDFYSDATPSTDTGVLQFGGRFITVGLSSVARKLSIPFDAVVAGPVSTGLVNSTTGATVTLVLAIGDVVIVEISYEAKQSNIANDINVAIELNAVVIGSMEPYRGVVNDVYIAVRRVVKFTAVAAIAHVFDARFGAGATTTTVQNVHLSVRHSNA